MPRIGDSGPSAPGNHHYLKRQYHPQPRNPLDGDARLAYLIA